MKSSLIFIRTFILFTIVGVLVETVIYMINPDNYKLLFIEILVDVFINVLLGLIMVYLFKDEVNSISEEEALNIMNRNNASVKDFDKTLIGELSKYKRFFMGNIIYDKS